MVVVAVAATAWAWLEPSPSLEAADAVEAAGSALEAAGVEATLDPDPARGRYTTSAGDDVEVWKVLARAEDGMVALWIAVDDGTPVFLDDRAPGGEGQVLPDHAVVAIGEHRSNPVRDQRIVRNVAATAAGVLVAATAAQVAVRAAARPDPTPRSRAVRRS